MVALKSIPTQHTEKNHTALDNLHDVLILSFLT